MQLEKDGITFEWFQGCKFKKGDKLYSNPTLEFMFKQGYSRVPEVVQEQTKTIEQFNAEQLELRKQDYARESDPLLYDYLRDEIGKQLWLDKCNEIKLRYPYMVNEGNDLTVTTEEDTLNASINQTMWDKIKSWFGITTTTPSVPS